MKNNTAKKEDVMASSVKIVDGKLILSLPEAETPVVWQMDLDHAKSSAFTVQEDKKAKNFTLVLKTTDGSIEEIAPFKTKEDAVEILMETSNVLQNAHGQIKPVSVVQNAAGGQPAATADKDEGSDKLGAVLAVALIIVLIFVWTISSSGPTGTLEQSAQNANTNALSGNVDPRQSSGVPVSADDFLSNR